MRDPAVSSALLLVRRIVLIAGALACAACATPEPPVKEAASPPRKFDRPPLFDSLLVVFRRTRADADSVALLALERGPYGDGDQAYTVIAASYSPGVHEQFGVFILNSSLNRVARVLDVFPTPRGRDYNLWIANTFGDSIVICGQGATYGDQEMRRAYARDTGAVELQVPEPGLDESEGSPASRDCPATRLSGQAGSMAPRQHQRRR